MMENEAAILRYGKKIGLQEFNERYQETVRDYSRELGKMQNLLLDKREMEAKRLAFEFRSAVEEAQGADAQYPEGFWNWLLSLVNRSVQVGFDIGREYERTSY